MSLTEFAFDNHAYTPPSGDNKWTNGDVFPTFEPDEDKVRSDMQWLFDMLGAKINEVIAALSSTSSASGASCIGVDPISGIDSSVTVQDALAAIYLAALQAQASTILDHSLASVKLSRKTDHNGAAVEQNNIAAGAVGTTELAASAVTGAKTNFSGGLTIGGQLTQNGKLVTGGRIILSSDCYGDSVPTGPGEAEAGRLFFVKAT